MKKKKSEYQPDLSTPPSLEEPMAIYQYSGPFNPGLLLRKSSTGSQPVLPKDPLSAIQLIKSGIPKKSLDDLQSATGLSPIEMSGFMHVSERTLRNYSDNTLLNPEMTERAIEIARLYELGSEVFGSIDAFRQYMNSPIPALGNQSPKNFLDTSMGIQYLMNELGRLQHGIYS